MCFVYKLRVNNSNRPMNCNEDSPILKLWTLLLPISNPLFGQFEIRNRSFDKWMTKSNYKNILLWMYIVLRIVYPSSRPATKLKTPEFDHAITTRAKSVKKFKVFKIVTKEKWISNCPLQTFLSTNKRKEFMFISL